jgi:hypothetical protein
MAVNYCSILTLQKVGLKLLLYCFITLAPWAVFATLNFILLVTYELFQ